MTDPSSDPQGTSPTNAGNTPNTGMRLFYPKIKYVDIQFHPHPQDKTVHHRMSTNYGDNFDFNEILNPSKTDFNDRSTLILLIISRTIKNIKDNAHATDDKTEINQYANHFSLLSIIDDTKIYKPIRNINFLERALVHTELTRGNNDLTLPLRIKWDTVYIKPNQDFIDIFNWSESFSTVYVPAHAQAQAGTPTGNTFPVQQANVITPQMQRYFDENTKVTQELAKLQSDLVTHIAISNNARTMTTIPPFVPRNFPQEVIARHRFNDENYKYHTNTELQPFMQAQGQPLKYYRDPSAATTSFVSRDGTYFVLMDLGSGNEKNFRQNVNKCSGTSRQAFHGWYNSFTAHFTRHGKYCHPYPCFTQSSTHPRGFSIGPNIHDNVPPGHMTKIDHDSRIIWDVLRVAFDKQPEYLSIVELYDGQGYEALRTIVAQTHPYLIENNTYLVTQRPQQGNLSLNEYWKNYNHYIMLRALIEDNPNNVHNKHERQHFIAGCKHYKFLMNEIRREELLPQYAAKFTPQNLISTLHQYLALPYSPTKNEKKTDMEKPRPRYRYKKEINMMNVEDDDPDIDESQIQMAYNYSINAITRDIKNFDRNCLVCEVITAQESNHKFEDCPILHNSTLLQKSFVNMCQNLKRIRNAENNKQINKMDITDSHDHDMQDLDDSPHAETTDKTQGF